MKQIKLKISSLLAANLRRLRVSRNLTLGQVGKTIGVSRQAIWNLENETSWITVDKIEKLALFFNVEQHELFQTKEPLKKK